MAARKDIPNIAIIIGTRPEAIKMAPVYLTLKNDRRMKVTMIVTAQHRHMLDQALGIFDIKPDIDLNIMQPNQSLSQISANVLTGVQRSLASLKPDAVLIHGDTTTCMCSALAAFYEHIPVGHVEAGLRTYNFDAPWPEEMNRRLADPICKWCFAPTQRAADNLRAENISSERIFITGNTVVDALLLIKKKISNVKPGTEGITEQMLDGKRMILVTGHRRESFGKPFEEFCLALCEIVEENPDVILVYPVHLNPNVQRPVNQILGNKERIYLIEPIEYTTFVYLMDRSYIIITDSGGIQEEAPSLGKPVLVTRITTERPEALEKGLAKLVGTDRNTIVKEANCLLSDGTAYQKMSSGKNPYGDGRASERIVEILALTL